MDYGITILLKSVQYLVPTLINQDVFKFNHAYYHLDKIGIIT